MNERNKKAFPSQPGVEQEHLGHSQENFQNLRKFVRPEGDRLSCTLDKVSVLDEKVFTPSDCIY